MKDKIKSSNFVCRNYKLALSSRQTTLIMVDGWR